MTEAIQRFGRRARLEHVLIMSLFTLLALSGIPQKFYPDPWAERGGTGIHGMHLDPARPITYVATDGKRQVIPVTARRSPRTAARAIPSWPRTSRTPRCCPISV